MSIKPSSLGIFITGTDTGVGKTYLSSRLIKALHQRGQSMTARKPVESGCRKTSEGSLFPDDGYQLYEAAGNDNLDAVTPFRYEAALAPPMAAALEGKTLQLSELSAVCIPTHGPLIVEGAGGFLSPIANDGLNADLAVALDLPLLIVAPDRLGCINHCLLTCEAIEKRGLEIIAIALSQLEITKDETMNNATELRRLISYPVYEIHYQANEKGIEDLALMIMESGWFGETEE
jgi:dethiobiotin synthetase